MTFTPLSCEEWKPGDFRMGASLTRGSHAIEDLAAQIGATLEHFVEDGLGPVKIFRATKVDGRQIAFDFYESGDQGPNLLVLFENDRCKGSEVLDALAFFGVEVSDVYWFAPEMEDA